MLCSRCSAPIKPVVAIDLDGTLADYHGHFRKFAESWLGFEGTVAPYEGDEPYKDYFCEEFGVDPSTFRAIKLAYRQGGMKRLQPVYPGARDLVVNLMEIGAEIWLTTTRPHDRFDRVDPDTREWLRRHQIPFDGLLYSEDKLLELSERVTPTRVVAVLDDQTDILDEADRYGWTSILRRTKYNRSVGRDGEYVLNLADAYSTIQVLLEAWQRRNG